MLWEFSHCYLSERREAQGIMGNVTLNSQSMLWHKTSLETVAKDFEFHFEMIMKSIFHSLKAMQVHAYPGLLWRRPSLSSGKLLCMSEQVRPGGLAADFIESWGPEGPSPLLFRSVEG